MSRLYRFLFIALVFHPLALEAQPLGIINGYVRSVKTQAPLSGVTIRLTGTGLSATSEIGRAHV